MTRGQKIAVGFSAAAMAVMIVMCAVMLGFFITTLPKTDEPAGLPAKTLSNEELYYNAVNDSMTINADEIKSHLAIVPGARNVTFNAENTKVRVMTFHKYPESYIDGSEADLQWGEVWTVLDKELIEFYNKEKGNNIKDWQMRFTQVVGGHFNSGYTHITAMWVNVSDLTRPAYNPDVTSEKTMDYVGGSTEYKAWFKGNVYNSYFGASYTWTRLGYTYDWATGAREFGVHELLANKGAIVDVEFTKSIAGFVSYLDGLNS